MARARNIKPAIFKNEILGMADPLLTLLFISLWSLADREGRLEDRPLRIKAETFPYREIPDFNGYLTQLARHGFIERYKIGDLEIIQIVNFRKHQSPHNTEKASELPERPIDMPITVKQPLGNVQVTQAKRPDSLIPDSLIPDKTHSSAFALPEWIDKDDWDLWMKTRKGKKMIPDQMQAQVNKLSKWKDAGLDYRKSLSDAAASGYMGLVEPKNNTRNVGSRIQEARLDYFDQVFGGLHHEHKRQIKDINPRTTIENNNESVRETELRLRESDG